MEKNCTGMAKASVANTPEAGATATAAADQASTSTPAAATTPMACTGKMAATSVTNTGKKECCGNCSGGSSCDPAHCDHAKAKGKANRKASL